MELPELTRQVAALRGRPAADAATILTDLVDGLAAVAADPRVDDDTARNLLARALRAVRPRATRPDDRHTALVALREALAEGARPPRRPTVGSARTVRAPDEVWASVDGYAADRGVSESRAAADLLAMTRCAHPGCERPFTLAAGGVGWCSVDHVPAGWKVFVTDAAGVQEVLLRLNVDPYRGVGG